MSDSLWSHGLNPPCCSVHGVLQARILRWVTILFSRGSSQLRAQTWVSCITGGFFTIWAIREALASLNLTILDTSYHNSQDIETPHPSINDEQTKTMGYKQTVKQTSLSLKKEGNPFSSIQQHWWTPRIPCPWTPHHVKYGSHRTNTIQFHTYGGVCIYVVSAHSSHSLCWYCMAPQKTELVWFIPLLHFWKESLVCKESLRKSKCLGDVADRCTITQISKTPLHIWQNSALGIKSL